jgi:hypothetical protein
MQRAMVAAGVLVSIADGAIDREEVHALSMELRGARFAHRSQLVHELADVPTLNPGSATPAAYAAYQDGGLETIRAAAAIVAGKAAPELGDFRAFLLKMAEAVAAANRKGGIMGVGLQRRAPEELAAIDAIRDALSP